MKKNLLALLLAAIMTSSLVACSGNFEIKDDEEEEEKEEKKDEDEEEDEDKDDKDESKAEGSFLPETNAPQPVIPETEPYIPTPAPADTTYMYPETTASDTVAPETAAPETEAPIITESVPSIETATPAPIPPAPTAPQTPAGMSIDRNVTVMYNGNEQEFFDADGNKIYPIDYNGVTYLPVDNIADMFNIASDYDSSSDTVLLGAYNDYMDFIETLTPYSWNDVDGYGFGLVHRKLAEKQSVTIANDSYDNYIALAQDGDTFFYNLEAKYTSLTFLAYHTDRNIKLSVIGDNDVVLNSVSITGRYLPVRVNVDVTGVRQLAIKIESGDGDFLHGEAYIVDAKIK